MDPSSTYVNNHHNSNHSRYGPYSASLNHHPPPPLCHPPASYQQSPNDLYPSRHHGPPAPPPEPRPPPPTVSQQQQQHQLYQTVAVVRPPPQRQQHPNHQPYDPLFSQYSFSPDFNSNSNPNTNHISHQFHDFPQRRVAEFDELPEYWPNDRSSRPLSLANLDREAHYHQLRPASPMVERFRHDIEGSSRFRNIEPNQRERGERGRVQSDSWTSDRSSREFGVGSMGFESTSKNLAFDHEVTENVRWGSRLRDKLIGNANSEINERNEMRIFPMKIEYRRDSETERFSDRRSSGERNHEFNRTPRKQIQKKSALLRIQKAKPNHRNREDERSHYLGYYKEGKTGAFRGKDLVLHSDHGMEEKEREGSPVELDVSFKSNSLVAKAIVTPTSGTVSDSNAMPKNSKTRRAMVFDEDCSSWQPNKAIVTGAKLDFSPSVVKSGSTANDSRQSETKVKSLIVGNVQDGVTKSCPKGANLTPRKGKFKKSSKVTVKLYDSSSVTEDAPISDKKKELFEGKGKTPSTGNIGGVVQTSSNRANVLIGESQVEGTVKSSVSDKPRSSVGKQSSLKASKKKIIVKKVVKKATNPPSNLVNSKSAKKGDQPVKADASTRCLSATPVVNKNATALETKINTATGDSVPDVDSECCTKESALLFENEKVSGATKSGTDIDPGSSISHEIKRKRNCLTPPLDSLAHKESKVGQDSLNVYNSALDLHVISNIKEVQSDTPNENVTAGTLIVEDVNKQFYHDNNINYGFLRSEDCNDHEDIVNVGSSATAMHASTSSECDSFTNQGINIVCGISNANYDCKQVCATPGSPLDKAGPAGHLLIANAAVGSNKMAHLPLSQETEIKNASIPADCFDQERSTIHTPDIGNVNLGENNREIGDYFVWHLSPSALSVGNSIPERIPNHVESAQCKDECAADVHKRKAGIIELDLSTSALSNISIGSADVLTPANVLNSTISTSDVNSNPPKLMADNKLLDVCLEHSVSKVSILHGSSSNVTFPDISATANEKFPENKRRKISTSNSSVIVSVISPEVAVSDICKSSIQVPLNSTDDVLPLEKEVKVSSTDDLHTEGAELLVVNSSVVGPSQAVHCFKDACQLDNPEIDPCAAYVGSVAPNTQCLNPLEVGGEKSSDATPFCDVNNHQIDAMDIEGDDRREVHVDAVEEQKPISSEVSWCKLTPEHTSFILDQRLHSADVEDDNSIPLKDDLPSALNCSTFGGSNDEAMPAPDILSGIGSPNNHDHLLTSSSTCKIPLCQKSEDKAYLDEKLLDDTSVIEGACNSSTLVSYSQHGRTILKLNDGNQTIQPIAGKVGLLPSHGSKNTSSCNFISRETHGRKTLHGHVAPKSYPTRQSFVFPASKSTSSTNITKPRTWRRTDNSSASPLSGNKPSLSANSLQRQMPEKAANFQSNSYVRKGNSLVRKPVSVPTAPQRSHSLSSSLHWSGVVDEMKKGAGPNNRVDAVELRTGSINTSFERPRTPPTSSVTKALNCASNSSGECTSSPFAEPAINDCCETTTSSMEINDLNSPEDRLKTFETLTQNGSDNNLEDWNEQNESNLVLSNAKRVTYVKPKSNQLVAASDSARASALNANKIQPFSASSDYYYKKNKNQLIRTGTESYIKEAITISSDKSNSVGQLAGKVISSRTFGKKRSNKAKTQKHSKFSMVWTLRGATLSQNDGNSPCCLRVLPQLFPWKRTTYRKSFKLNSISSCNNPLYTIGGKMLLPRKRDTLYTRSTKGFSIRKSKVLSVGGSSLKWSKSIEKNSRKANEEATLAVAEAERKKREHNGTVSGTGRRSYSHHKVVCGTELRPGERIFRIGSMHYKMDSSRRSLQRISGDESLCPAGHQSENSTKISYVPRRLVIGNDEYVRVGNGNQLVRNPKKRTRVLASEKVRWSLHTARLKLIKNRKYCQFFTRFGKCNKEDGKCPYIHDPSKTAVCTKFLKGLCSNSNCKLTHKVIPERMPDCSYFLQGLCTNENCPYRHVYVNPNASTCEGFLRGYCADGNECRKKHSYVCPDFEATGSCPQGSKCKLHHPKKQSRGKKRKRSTGHKNARGRYFGIDILEPKRIVSERHQGQGDNEGLFDDKLSEYISLDVSDDEAKEIHLVMSDEATFGDNDSSDLGLDDLDELIKPIRIMNKR